MRLLKDHNGRLKNEPADRANSELPCILHLTRSAIALARRDLDVLRPSGRAHCRTGGGVTSGNLERCWHATPSVSNTGITNISIVLRGKSWDSGSELAQGAHGVSWCLLNPTPVRRAPQFWRLTSASKDYATSRCYDTASSCRYYDWIVPPSTGVTTTAVHPSACQ